MPVYCRECVYVQSLPLYAYLTEMKSVFYRDEKKNIVLFVRARVKMKREKTTNNNSRHSDCLIGRCVTRTRMLYLCMKYWPMCAVSACNRKIGIQMKISVISSAVGDGLRTRYLSVNLL